MKTTQQRRRLRLFIAVVALPSLLFLALALRGLRQERELANRRRDDRKLAVVRLVGRELQSRLAALAKEIFDSPGGDAWRRTSGNMMEYARLQGGRLVLHWDSTATTRPDAAVSARLLDAERLELVTRDPAGAARRYREIMRSARDTESAPSIRLKLVRALRDAGDFKESWNEATSALATPISSVDLSGTPWALYAAVQLLGSADHHTAVVRWLGTIRDELYRLPPSALLLASRVTDSLIVLSDAAERPSLKTFSESVTERLHLAERMLVAQAAFTLSSTRPSSDPATAEVTWLAYGNDPVMIGPFPVTRTESGDSLVAIIAAGPLLDAMIAEGAFGKGPAPRVRNVGDEGVSVGPRLSGLSVSVNDASLGGTEGSMQLFYVAGLALVLLIAATSALLLWRDVRREAELSELRATFVSNVSHELKTPLTSIRLFAETLNTNAVTDERERREYLDTIVAESERLSRLLNQVLDFGQIERGEKKYERRPESLSAIARDTVRTAEPWLATQGYQLDVSIEDDLPSVLVDRDAVEQAILNLLSNAMKYSGNRKDIHLRLRRDERHALIEVIDHGIGIPFSEQERIFDRYYRVPAADHSVVPGSGLGLTLVRHIVTAHGGQITVQSAPSQGSTFTVRLPLEPAL